MRWVAGEACDARARRIACRHETSDGPARCSAGRPIHRALDCRPRDDPDRGTNREHSFRRLASACGGACRTNSLPQSRDDQSSDREAAFAFDQVMDTCWPSSSTARFAARKAKTRHVSNDSPRRSPSRCTGACQWRHSRMVGAIGPHTLSPSNRSHGRESSYFTFVARTPRLTGDHGWHSGQVSANGVVAPRHADAS